jgi:hypothetical protein
VKTFAHASESDPEFVMAVSSSSKETARKTSSSKDKKSEPAHLKHYDHSAKFWALVSTQSADFKKSRRWLKENPYLGDFLNEQSELGERAM